MSEELKHEVKVTTELWKNAEGMFMNLVTDLNGEVTKKVIALQEQATIDALKRLGWTPPDEPRPEPQQSHDEAIKSLVWMRNTIMELYASVTKSVINQNMYEIVTKEESIIRQALQPDKDDAIRDLAKALGGMLKYHLATNSQKTASVVQAEKALTKHKDIIGE